MTQVARSDCGALTGSRAAGAAEWATPPHLLGCVPQTNRIFLLWWLFFLFPFLLAFKTKKKSLAIQMGFLHYNTVINETHVRPVASACSPSGRPPRLGPRSAELSRRRAQPGQSGQANKYTSV